MAFSKTFPRTLKGSTYPLWEEIYLSDKEEREVEEHARKENVLLMKECLDEAKKILIEKGYKEYQSDTIRMAISLFDKVSSHQIYHKERRVKEIFDEQCKDNSSR